MANDFQAVVDAIHDLTLVVIATQGNSGSRADVVRRLAELSIPPARIAGYFGDPTEPGAFRFNQSSEKNEEHRAAK